VIAPNANGFNIRYLFYFLKYVFKYNYSYAVK